MFLYAKGLCTNEARRGFNAQPGSKAMTKTAVQDQCGESEKTTLLSTRDISACGRRKKAAKVAG
jgi:hypothetical protein